MRMTILAWLSIFTTLYAQPNLAGAWQGDLKVSGMTLRLRLNVTGETGAWKATLDSLDQAAIGIPVQEVHFTDGKLTWKIPAINASYEGTANSAGDSLNGQFTQNGATIPLSLNRLALGAAASAPPKRPQSPKPPFPYRIEEVTFPSLASGVVLAGTLTIPEGKGPHPALVLVSGSGPQDRDESLLGHKPFAVLADYLGRNGIAVLRFDDRGVAKSTGAFAGATSADFANDAEGAVNFLLARPGFRKVGIGGHSEGGLIAPIVAARNPKVGFVVMLAGTGVSGDQVLEAQGVAIRRASGAPEETIEKNRKMQAAVVALVVRGGTNEEILTQARRQLPDFPGLEQTVKVLNEPWMRHFLAFDPGPTLAKVKCPVLVLNGDLDLQVLPDQNVPAIEAALRKGGNRRVTVRRFPKLNHLFQTATKGAPSEYAQIEETIAPVALDTIATWLAQFKK